MMQTLKVEGMTCNGCVNSVQKNLNEIDGVIEAKVSLHPPQAIINTDTIIPLSVLQAATGKYILKAEEEITSTVDLKQDLPDVSINTYKPLMIIVLFIAGTSGLAQFNSDQFDFMLWMRHFMAGFFLVFSFFKLLNIRGFADSYSMYDVVARNWKSWGFIYPFVELTLGIAYLINYNPLITNILTIVVLGVSIIGVIQSNLNKKKIKCACLGDVFNLPMSTVTIIEDLTMIVMAIAMLLIM